VKNTGNGNSTIAEIRFNSSAARLVLDSRQPPTPWLLMASDRVTFDVYTDGPWEGAINITVCTESGKLFTKVVQLGER